MEIEKSSFQRAFIFDLDGTIVHLPHDRNALETIRKNLLDKIKLELNVSPPSSRIFDIYGWICKNFSNKLKLIRNMKDTLDEYELSIVPKAHIIDGTIKFLESLKKNKEKSFKGLLTNNGGKMVDALKQEYPIFHDFSRIVTRDDVDFLKPDTEGIARIMAEVSVKELIYVGDSDVDRNTLEIFKNEQRISNTMFLYVEDLNEECKREEILRRIFQ